MKREKIYKGHIVHCLDLDSRDEFNIEVGIIQGLKGDDLFQACENAAKKHDLVTLSGNSFEFEYVQPSGRVTRYITIVTKEDLIPMNKEAEELLEQRHID